MTHTGNGKPLLGGGGGQQCPGSAEQDFFQLSAVQLIQQIPAKGDGAASAAGAAGMDILYRIVKYGGAAIHELSAKGQAVQTGQFQKHLHAHLPQISGDDPVKVLRTGIQVGKMGLDGRQRRRG